MDIKDFIEVHGLWWFGLVHDPIEMVLRRVGIEVFKVEKTYADIWRVQAYMRGAGSLGARLDFVRYVRPRLLAAGFVSRSTEICQSGYSDRVTISFIYPGGELGGLCYRKTQRGRIVRCQEFFSSEPWGACID